jgi:hypothetical protein
MQYGLNVKTKPFEFAAGPFESYLEMEDETLPICTLGRDFNTLKSFSTEFKSGVSKARQQVVRSDLIGMADAMIGLIRSGDYGKKGCARQDFKRLRDEIKKLRPGLPGDLTYKLNQLIYWARKAGEGAASELEWESEEEVTTSRVLPVKFRRDFNQFRLEMARAIGRWTVYRSDQGQRALKHVTDNDNVLRDFHKDLLNQGVSEGKSVPFLLDFIYAGQGSSRRVKQVRISGFAVSKR